MNAFLTEHWIAGFWTLLFLGLNALLVACELALIKVRFSHFNPDLVERLRARRGMARFFEDADRIVQAIRLGTTFCVLGYGMVLFPPLQQVLIDLELAVWGLETPLSLILAFGLAVSIHYVVAESFPRGLGLQYPLETLLVTSWPVRFLRVLARPFARPLEGLAAGLLRLFGVNDQRQLETLDLEAQLELLGEDSTRLPAAVQKILRNALNLRDLVVSDVLLPRNQVQIFSLKLSNEENLKLARETGHTRFPLCDGDLDHCVGLIHIKDLFRAKGDLRSLNFRRFKREMIRVDSEEPLETALTKLLYHKVHMALVIDEFRGVEGVLTLERVLEQLVGDIRDEFDTEEEVWIRPSVGTPDEILVAGLTPLHEVEERLNVEIDNEDVSTVSGLITSELGRIPEVGERVTFENLLMEVTQVDETRVLEARIRLRDPRGESPDDGPQPV